MISKSKKIIILFILNVIINLASYNLGHNFTNYNGPSGRVAETAKSIWNSGNLETPENLELAKNISESASKEKQVFWQDAFALEKNGRIYPKHSLITSLIAAPFYGAFGEFGFLIFQTLNSFGVCICLSFSLSKFTKNNMYFFSLFGLSFLTQTFIGRYNYDFGYDLHAAFFILLGLALSFNFPFWGSFSYTLSLFVRPSHILILPFLLISQEEMIKNKKFLRNALLGFSFGLILYTLNNYYLWGSPFLTSYDRIPFFDENGQMFITEHLKGFDWMELRSNLKEKLFGLKHGLITYNLCYLAFPLVIWHIKNTKLKISFCSLLLGSIIYTIYIFSYGYLEASGIGNRFLLPAIYLYLICFGIYVAEIRAVTTKEN